MDRLELIKRNTQEIVEECELIELLKNKKRPTAYIGYAPTGRLHIGHLIPLLKVADCLKAGLKFKFLLADVHSFLDDQKTPWHLLNYRAEYYKEAIKGVLESYKISRVGNLRLKFIKGSSFQLSADYVVDILKMANDCTVNRSRRAASEVIRFKDEPKLAGLIYPLMQIEDVVALKADIALGGIDQRGIYMLGRELLPRLGYNKYVCVFNPLLPGLAGGKMSASDLKSKIDLLDDPETIRKKVNSTYCVAGEVENNGILIFLEYLIFPLKERFEIKREQKHGGNKVYTNYKEFKEDFIKKKIHPEDLKKSFSDELITLLGPVRKRFSKRRNLKLIERAYPVE